MRAEGLGTEIVDDDERIWDEQRAAQRGPLVVKVPRSRPGSRKLLRVAGELGGTVVGRVALGLSWVRFEEPRRRAWSGSGATQSPSCRTARPTSTWTRRTDGPGYARADAARQGALRSRRGVL